MSEWMKLGSQIYDKDKLQETGCMCDVWDAALAEQIVREHNAHEAMVAALESKDARIKELDEQIKGLEVAMKIAVNFITKDALASTTLSALAAAKGDGV
jgi:hypothetical protein